MPRLEEALGAAAAKARNAAFGLLDLVVPPVCLLCGEGLEREGEESLCPACDDGLPSFSRPLCAGCGGAPVRSALDFCPPCRGTCSRDGLVVLGPFKGGVRDLVHAFKYRADFAAGRYLARRLAMRAAVELGQCCDLVVPVPLHRRRLRSRGFNQAALLARRISKQTGRPLLARALERRIHTRSLTGLDLRERKREVRGAMNLRRGVSVEGRRVLVVDDVFTSGATTEECCRILKRAGASRVFVAAVARV